MNEIKMIKHLLIELFVLFQISVSAQEVVPFLEKKPIIDGIADESLPQFKLQSFHNSYKSNETNPDIKIGYYLAYGTTFLYVCIEEESDSIIYRDRAYQNGDGFQLMIGKSHNDGSPTDEFYLLAFSPKNSWYHQMIWYYNINLTMSRLSKKVEFEVGKKPRKISFELLIPWESIKPYHPWLSKDLAFNLCFVKAISEKEKNYYFIKMDERMQNEQSKRKYINLNFEIPQKNTSLYSSLVRNNISEKERLSLYITGFSNNATTKNILIYIISGENSIVSAQKHNIKVSKGIFKEKISIKDTDLIPGGYKIKVFNGNELIGKHYISVFPNINFELLRKRVVKMKSSISTGTYNTLLFYINDLESTFNKLKTYENSYEIRKKIAIIDNYINNLNRKNDLIKLKKGTYRRAFLSKIDTTLRPYSIYIPNDYSTDKKFPLLVYLHGSGDDDRVLSVTPKIQNNFVILAPNGRGSSNCFTGSKAQTDIVESIHDVIQNFSIDTNKIILSGFSMGGYGVYRTYYEHPTLFKAIAVISGHPNLAQQWINKTELNFLDKKNLKLFRQIPIYIFHGKEDFNCPFELTEQLVNELKSIGCNVTFEIDNTGHGNMPPEARKKYYDWLKKQIE